MLGLWESSLEREDMARSIHSKEQSCLYKKQMSSIPQLNKLTLGPLLTKSKGAKQIQILNDGGPLIWTPTEYLEIPFEPSHFSDKESSRLSICFAPTPEI